MFTSAHLKAVITEARPIIERQLDDAELIAGIRTKVTNDGGDWGQVKALLKAMIQDERDEAGDGKRVKALLGKAENATAYADMLGLGNEKNSFEDDFDPITGEIIDTNSADPTHVAADQSTGNVDGSAGRSHSDPRLSTESPASVPVDTNFHLQHDAGDRADTDPHSLVGSSNSHLQDDLGDQAGAAAAGLSNSCDMRRDSLKPVGLSIGAADIPHHGAVG